MLSLIAALQVVFVLVIRGPYSRGVSWPVETMGIIATITLLAGYIPVPFELIRRRGRVVGIDLLFLLMDCSGAFFSLMSLGMLSSFCRPFLLNRPTVAQNSFDVLFGTLYSVW